MILIVSTSHDWTTNDVVQWINHFEVEYFRLNVDLIDELQITIKINLNCFTILDTRSQEICLSEKIKVVWYRRSYPYVNSDLTIKDPYIKSMIDSETQTEHKFFLKSIFDILKDRFWLNHFSSIQNDKIETLLEAKSVGLKIPSTIITTSKHELSEFMSRYQQVIIKPIYNVGRMELGEDSYMAYTRIITPELYDSLEENFFPSLFQEYIAKEIEIRSFFLDGNFYSMGIFSQSDVQTMHDFRKYNYQKPNRTVNLELPDNIKSKLKKLMSILQLNSGSIDIIKSLETSEYFFLEVNPVGQFGMTSWPTNTNLEKKVAQLLISKNNSL